MGDTPARLTSADPSVVRTIVRAPLLDQGLWFDDASCREQFARPRMIEATELDAFSRCLAGLHLVTTARRLIPSAVIVRDRLGLELEAWVVTGTKGGQLLAIGFLGSHDAPAWVPALSPEALEARRVDGRVLPLTDADLPAIDAELHARNTRLAFVSLRVCIDREGKVIGTHIHQTTSHAAAHAMTVNIAAWRFQPLVLGGTAMPACAMLSYVYPSTADQTLAMDVFPPPLDPSTEGVPLGPPSEGTTTRNPHLDLGRYRDYATVETIVSARFCTDPSGKVTVVKTYEPSGDPERDQALLRTFEKVRFTPTIIDGTPRAVCTFAYAYWVR